MIGGQYLDLTGGGADLAALHRLKTGASSRPRSAARSGRPSVPEPQQPPWRAFADELGLLFQIVDDILDGDGYVLEHGAERSARPRRRGRRAGTGAALSEIDADTAVLDGIVAGLAARTS